MDEPACGLTQLNASRGGETLEKRATKSEETHPAVTMLAGGTANTKRARVSQDGCSDARVLAMTGAKSAIAADPKLSAALQKNVGQVCNLSVTWVAKRSEKIGVTSDKMGHERTRDSPAFRHGKSEQVTNLFYDLCNDRDMHDRSLSAHPSYNCLQEGA